jgi:hypothetical protein
LAAEGVQGSPPHAGPNGWKPSPMRSRRTSILARSCSRRT